MDFYQCCVLAAVAAFLVLVVFAVRTLIQVTRTAESVEYLATITAENVEKTRPAFELMDNVASLLDSTFYKVMKVGFDLVKKYHAK